jgi:hypothetical protein
MRPCLKVQITCADAWRCPLLFRPVWQSCRNWDDSNQYNMNNVRSMRPSSCSARSSWFWRWYAASRFSIAGGNTMPTFNEVTRTQDLIPVLADDIRADPASKDRLQIFTGCDWLDASELAIGEVPQPRIGLKRWPTSSYVRLPLAVACHYEMASTWCFWPAGHTREK